MVRSSSVGHEFVCDGYDGNGYFHFNWGWGGMSDGYFLLDALNPGAVGTLWRYLVVVLTSDRTLL